MQPEPKHIDKKYVIIHGLNVPDDELHRVKEICNKSKKCDEIEIQLSTEMSEGEKYKAVLVEMNAKREAEFDNDIINFDAIIEDSPDANKIAKILVEAASNNRIIFSFSTASSYKMVLSYTVSKFISRKVSMGAEALYAMNVALHEAITNAIIHGNLELQSNFKDLDSFISYYDEVEKRLKSGPYGNRRVNVEVEILPESIIIYVMNDGEGYDPSKIVKKNDEAASGRGISMISTFTKSHEISDNGRIMKMEFERN